MKPLPPHEQLSVSTDLPLIERWIEDNLVTAQATVAIDRAAFDSNMGHVILVVSVRQLSELDRARDELTALVVYPDRLRVRRWKPTEAQLHRIHEWIWSGPVLPAARKP
jgi:sensor histidine kinase regulating citrate/malate metabolism